MGHVVLRGPIAGCEREARMTSVDQAELRLALSAHLRSQGERGAVMAGTAVADPDNNALRGFVTA
jgi:hypothetical protein